MHQDEGLIFDCGRIYNGQRALQDGALMNPSFLKKRLLGKIPGIGERGASLNANELKSETNLYIIGRSSDAVGGEPGSLTRPSILPRGVLGSIGRLS